MMNDLPEGHRMTGRGSTVTLHEGVRERLLAMRDRAGESLIRIPTATTPAERDQLLREALHAADSLVSCLVAVLAGPGDLDLFPEPYNEASLGFANASGYHGGRLWHPGDHRFQIHT